MKFKFVCRIKGHDFYPCLTTRDKACKLCFRCYGFVGLKESEVKEQNNIRALFGGNPHFHVIQEKVSK